MMVIDVPQYIPPTGFLAELVRNTLLGAAIGVVLLMLVLIIQNLFDLKNRIPGTGVSLLIRVGIVCLVVPIIFAVWVVSAVNPKDWKTLMFVAGLIMVGIGYFLIARRWGRGRGHGHGEGEIHHGNGL